jgi:D-sedoheptulose 7-phosphate isomerase
MNWNRMAEEMLAVADEVIGPLQAPIEELAAEMARRLRGGAKVLVCGNGGSAADAQHLAGELVNRFLKERRPYAAIALSTDTSVLTSIGNDYGFAQVFEKQVRALGRKELGLLTVAVTGGSGGRLLPLVDRPLCVASTASTPRIQEGHQFVIHALCERVEELMES